MDKIINFLTEKPGYMKTASDKLAIKLECREEDVKKAIFVIRKQTAYNKFLEEQDIDQNDVKAAWIKTKRNTEYIDFSILKSKSQNYKEEIAEAFGQIDYSFPEVTRTNDIPRVGIINLFDAHIDKISFISQTGEDVTMDDNIKIFFDAFFKLLNYAKKEKLTNIIFPVGSDFWQVNDTAGTTKKGTPQHGQVYPDAQHAFRAGLTVLRICIEKIAEFADVTVIPVKGNHDEDRVMYLTETLLVAYPNHKNIKIVDTFTQRNYVQFGVNLFGFAHGDKEQKMISNLPMLMATENREAWATVKQGVFFLGHIHSEKKAFGFTTQDFMGVSVRFLRATSTTDKWHYEYGWVGVPKTGYLFVYSNDASEELEYKVNV